MSFSNTTWGIVLKKQLSGARVCGMGLFLAWTFVTFYSIVPYSHAANVRATLYASQLFSLIAMTCTMLFVALVVHRGDALASNKMVVFGAATAMTAGTVLTLLADNSTVNGTLLLGFGSVLTGSGSAVVLLCWGEVISWQGERLALVELAFSFSVAFMLAFLIVLAPVLVSNVATVGTCIGTAALLYRFGVCGEASAFRADERAGTGRTPLSRSTLGLFAKALCGVALVGLVSGFFDVLSGYDTFPVQDVYGLWLYLAGLMVSLALAAVAVLLHHDGSFFGYRICMLLICLGCLLTPFLSQSSNVGALIFGGYHGYQVVLCSICIGVATSFCVGTVRAIGIAYVALYGGELVGVFLAHGLGRMGDASVDLALLTLVAVSLLFISHLFLFTESDLVKIGIGEVNLSLPARRKLEELGAKLPGEGNGTRNAKTGREGAEAPRFVQKDMDSGAQADGLANGKSAADLARERYMGCAMVTAVADALTSDVVTSAAATGDDGDASTAPALDPAAVIVERFGLSPRESDVLPLLLEGRTIARIQETLFISQGTVSTHIRHIYQKTGASNRQELIDLAHRISEE